MRITEAHLRRLIRDIIREERSRLDEETVQQAKVRGPLKDLFTSLQTAKSQLGKDGAKKAISDLVSSAGGAENVMTKAEKLLGAVKGVEDNLDKILRWLNTSAAVELTKDPWAHVGKRD